MSTNTSPTAGARLRADLDAALRHASQPMDINEGATADQVLRVEFGDDVDLGDFELIGQHKPYRERCAPAEPQPGMLFRARVRTCRALRAPRG
jgi:hypothetical protein